MLGELQVSRDYFKMKLQWGVVLVEGVPYLVDSIQSPEIDPPEELDRGSSLARYTDWFKENMYLLLIGRDPILFKDVQIIHPEDQYVKLGSTIHYFNRYMGRDYKIVPHGDSYGLSSSDMLRAITFIQNPTYRKRGLSEGVYSPQVAIINESLMYRGYCVGVIQDGSIKWKERIPDSILKELKGIFKVRTEGVTEYKTETLAPLTPPAPSEPALNAWTPEYGEERADLVHRAIEDIITGRRERAPEDL